MTGVGSNIIIRINRLEEKPSSPLREASREPN